MGFMVFFVFYLIYSFSGGLLFKIILTLLKTLILQQ